MAAIERHRRHRRIDLPQLQTHQIIRDAKKPGSLTSYLRNLKFLKSPTLEQVMAMPMVQFSESLIKELGKIAIPFEETTPEHVVARLVREHLEANSIRREPAPPISSEGLVGSGVVIPNGTRFRGRYRGRQVEAEVRDGRLWVGEQPYTALSAGAVGAAEMLGGRGGALNGWYWWQTEVPPGSGTWVSANEAFRTGSRARRRR
jgi:hypothetical protein